MIEDKAMISPEIDHISGIEVNRIIFIEENRIIFIEENRILLHPGF